MVAADDGSVDFNDWTVGEPPLSDKRNCIYEFPSDGIGAHQVFVWWSPEQGHWDLGTTPAPGLEGVMATDRSDATTPGVLMTWEKDGLSWAVETRAFTTHIPETIPVDVLYDTLEAQSVQIVQRLQSVTYNSDWWDRS
jgi:hypothetical protein